MSFLHAQAMRNMRKTPEKLDIGDIAHGSGRAKTLAARLAALGVELSIDADGRLVIDAPAGVLTDDLLAQVRADRAGLLTLLAVGFHGDEPEPAEAMALGPAWVCPLCLAGDRLADDPEGLRCGRCDRLAFLFHGASIVRSDWVEPRLIGGRELIVLDSLRCG